MGSHFLLQWNFPTQELNPGLPHCRQILYNWAMQEDFPCFWERRKREEKYEYWKKWGEGRKTVRTWHADQRIFKNGNCHDKFWVICGFEMQNLFYFSKSWVVISHTHTKPFFKKKRHVYFMLELKTIFCSQTPSWCWWRLMRGKHTANALASCPYTAGTIAPISSWP